MKFLKALGIFLVIAVCLTICTFAIGGMSKAPWEWDYDYVVTEASADSVMITGHPNVRSEPIVADDHESSSTTSYGQFQGKDSRFVMYVTRVYHERESEYSYEPLDVRNGAFIGLSVADIQNHPDWENHFPRDIVRDPDGIVWIHHDYISVSR